MKRKRLQQKSLAEIRAFEAEQLDDEQIFFSNTTTNTQWIQKVIEHELLRSKRDNEKKMNQEHSDKKRVCICVCIGESVIERAVIAPDEIIEAWNH